MDNAKYSMFVLNTDMLLTVSLEVLSSYISFINFSQLLVSEYPFATDTVPPFEYIMRFCIESV